MTDYGVAVREDSVNGGKAGSMQVTARVARSRCPSTVSIVATVDSTSRPRGFTAGSFTWLTSCPPRVAFTLARSADSYAAFERADGFSVNVLRADDEKLATRFATKGADKFAGGEFSNGAGRYPELSTAAVVLQCRVHERLTGSDHLFVIGEVVDARVSDGDVAAIIYGNTFRSVEDLPPLRSG